MNNMRVYFEIYEGNLEDLNLGYKEVSFNIIFDVNMGYNLYHKVQMILVGHKNSTPSYHTYSSVISRESVRIALKTAALNGLKFI